MHHPANARSDATTVLTDHNYKLVWTPTWLAWLVDDVVYRNESNQFRGMTKEAGMAYTPGYVPWRAVTMRPLLRTNIGSAPAITGKLKAACGSLAAGTEVTVPAGLIQVLDGTFVANHTIVGFGSAATATVNILTNWDISLKATKTYDYANNDCSPCNLLATEPTYLCKAAVLTAPALTFLPQSTMFIRCVLFFCNVACRVTNHAQSSSQAPEVHAVLRGGGGVRRAQCCQLEVWPVSGARPGARCRPRPGGAHARGQPGDDHDQPRWLLHDNLWRS